MIVFTIYFLVFGILIYKTNLFGVLKDNILNSRFYTMAYLIKCLGVGMVAFIYQKLYGTANYLDAGNFFHDSKVIHDIAAYDPGEFFKVMFGFHDESPDSELYKKFFMQTTVWDKNPAEFLYNDNRIIVRLHALIHFISFNNYFVHALISAIISLIGIHWIYKTFRFLFPGKEVQLFLCWLIFPGILFWTSGLFKEAPTVFTMGMMLISLKRMIIDKRYAVKYILCSILGIWISLLLKPYILIPVLLLTLLFFTIYALQKVRNKTITYIVAAILLVIIGNIILRSSTSQSILSLMAKRQFTFVDMSRGGIFLLNDKEYARLPYDFSLIDTTLGKDNIIIKKGTHYISWEHSHQQDTLYCVAYTDTRYKVHYTITPAHSAIHIPQLKDNLVSFLSLIPAGLYITLFKPFFFDAHTGVEMIASFENIIVLLAIILFLFGIFKTRFKNPWHFYFLSLVFSTLLIIGITSPNLGAIERYRSPLIPFLLMASILSINSQRFEQNRVFILFKRPSE